MCGIAGWIDYTQNSGNETIFEKCSISKKGAAGETWESNDPGTRYCYIGSCVGSTPPAAQAHAKQQYGNLIVSYLNGELYNTEDHPRELLQKGYTFSGPSDSEVLLANRLPSGGRDCVEKFNGIYFLPWGTMTNSGLFLRGTAVGSSRCFIFAAANDVFASVTQNPAASPRFPAAD